MTKITTPLVVRYRDATYDLAEFAHKHPGGINTLKGLHNQDMQERFERTPGHSEAARYLMKEYRICDKNNNNDGGSNGTINDHQKDVTGHGKNGLGKSNGMRTEKRGTSNGDIPQPTDDSMEVGFWEEYGIYVLETKN